MSSLFNILRIVTILLAIVAGIITDIPVLGPYIAAILVVLGIIGAFDTPDDRRLPIMVSTLILMGVSSTLAAIPTVGVYLPTSWGISESYLQ
ncbi:MAG: hypothetical protein O2910_04835, partial [Proteobacteria bacterium]|nr:hypothetical protein [Pseudomonadota bacterium]